MKNSLLHFFKSRKSDPESLETIKALFLKFRSILELNTKFLEKISEMELSLSGEFVFDSAYLNKSVQDVTDLVYQIVYSLNALSNNRYIGLFDRFQAMKAILENILEGGLGPYGNKLTVPCSLVRLEMETLVGPRNASLGEIAYNLGKPVQDGFIVTATAHRLFIEENNLGEPIRLLELSNAPEEKTQPKIKELFQQAIVSEELKASIDAEISALFKRSGRESCLYMDPEAVMSAESETLPAQNPEFVFNISRERVIDAYKELLADYTCKQIQCGGSVSEGKTPLLSVSVREMMDVRISGTVMTVNPENTYPGSVVITATAGTDNLIEFAEEGTETYITRKLHPFDLLESIIYPKPIHSKLPDGNGYLDMMESNLLRGSALLNGEKRHAIVETAVGIERILGMAQTIHWAENSAGIQVILATVSISDSSLSDDSSSQLITDIGDAELLIEHGETAQVGIAAGKVVHVSENTALEEFPAGSIAVARNATPSLSQILRKAGALITEVGSPAGHLATIAREFRIPTIVGVPGARAILLEGSEVTIDAEECKVYQGIIETLLNYQSSKQSGLLFEPEYKILRQLLRYIVPLRLIDPISPEFTASNCESLHDIIHFSHEKAVDEIINLHERHGKLNQFQPRTLQVNIPLQIVMLDMGGGLAEEAPPQVSVADVRSGPFRALLQGLLSDDVWDQQPSHLSLRDIFSGMDRTQQILDSKSAYVGQNLAIIADNYLNLSLRLGYHFNVIDAYLSESINENYIYFRFVGGFADLSKRRHRVELIKLVLEKLNFRVKTKGDLVVGKLKMEDADVITAVLGQIGKLVAFTRQLDVKMVSESEVNSFYQLFLEKIEPC
ncbi:MAG: hypothetical protein HQ517_12645 [SAR324 cluster bacterium]|nr:hypothetical protein [SAR324 cluster bacterium]